MGYQRKSHIATSLCIHQTASVTTFLVCKELGCPAALVMLIVRLFMCLFMYLLVCVRVCMLVGYTVTVCIPVIFSDGIFFVRAVTLKHVALLSMGAVHSAVH